MKTFASSDKNLFHANYEVLIDLHNFCCYGNSSRELISRLYGSYQGVIKREAVYKGTNKDYLPKAKPSKLPLS